MGKIVLSGCEQFYAHLYTNGRVDFEVYRQDGSGRILTANDSELVFYNRDASGNTARIWTKEHSVIKSSASDFFTPSNCTVGDEHYLYKYGKCVMVKLVVTTTVSLSAGNLYVGKIASTYAPKIQARVHTAQSNVIGFVTADGNMYVQDIAGVTHSSGYRIDMWLTYMMA